MRAYRLDRLSDAELLRGLASLVSQDRSITAALLAHIAEVDARKLYAPAGYASMQAYCVGELRLSEDAAAKRIHAARAAREVPLAFEMLADGRLHLSGLCLLAAHLNPHTADQLLAEATHRTKSEIEQLLAARFPRTESLPLVCAVAGAGVPSAGVAGAEHAPGHVRCVAASTVTGAQHAPGHVAARVAPIAAQRFVIQVSVSQETRDKLEQLRELLSHSGCDLAEVLDYALAAGIARAEKRKFAATDKPRAPRASANPRHIPAHVRRAVHARDGRRCSYVSDDGHRCASRSNLEYDHITPVARGGASTIDNVRLRCRTHNQLAAEQVYGVGFMQQKRDAAREAAESERMLDVIAALRGLGYRKEQAHHAAQWSSHAGISLEAHVRAALQWLCPKRGVRHEPAA